MNKEYLDKLKRASTGNMEALESLEMSRREAIDHLQGINNLAWLSSIKKVLDEFVPLPSNKKSDTIKKQNINKAKTEKQLRLF